MHSYPYPLCLTPNSGKCPRIRRGTTVLQMLGKPNERFAHAYNTTKKNYRLATRLLPANIKRRELYARRKRLRNLLLSKFLF